MSFLPETASLNEWLEFIESLHPSNIELGLSRVTRVAERLELLPATFTSVVVAGTNGKGSTITSLAALLNQAKAPFNGRPSADAASVRPSVGVYTSPHIRRFNERIVIDEQPVDDVMLCKALRTVFGALSDDRLTYFEFTTLSALLLFSWADVDIALLEVGLGGRLDAVNIVTAELAIITSIALDHQDWLGDDRESIAVEKGGIIRDKQVLIVGEPDIPNSLLSLITARADRGLSVFFPHSSLGVPLVSGNEPALVSQNFHGFVESDDGSLCWELTTNETDCQGSRHYATSLTSSDFTLNQSAWSCALTAYHELQRASVSKAWSLPDVSEKALDSCFRQTALLGRSSRHPYGQRIFVLDVAHNPAAIDDLVARASSKDMILFSAMGDKDIRSMLSRLLAEFEHVALVGLPGNPRSASVDQLEGCAAEITAGDRKSNCFSTHDNMSLAINWTIQHTPPNATIWVAGSFFTVDAALTVIEP